LGSGDLHVVAGNYLLQVGEINLGNRKMECDPGAYFNQPTAVANRAMFQVNSGEAWNCNFRGPYYNVNGAGLNPFFIDFLHVNPPSNGFKSVGNAFNGSGGYTGAIDVYANDAQQGGGGYPATNGYIGYNTFSHCTYYAVQLTSATNFIIEKNTNSDCAGYIEADDRGQANTGNIVRDNTLAFPFGTGWSNYGAGSFSPAGAWANELTCGQSASATPFDYSGNTCQNNIVDGTAPSMIAITPFPGGVAAQYIGNVCNGGCRVY
jgi:hypothetical protein